MKKRTILLLGGVAALVLTSGQVARAAHAPDRALTRVPITTRKAKARSPVKKKANKLEVLTLKPMVLTGKKYIPQTFHVINRKYLDLHWSLKDPRFDSAFLDRIAKAVRQRPF